jgi:hypothetical protein
MCAGRSLSHGHRYDREARKLGEKFAREFGREYLIRSVKVQGKRHALTIDRSDAAKNTS